jgi:quercetin 2,3-dioxygenase
MEHARRIHTVTASRPTMEGAGVRLRRAFGFGDTATTDPFLLLDDFRGDDPHDYIAGFPWHPHRGIETITYILEGTVEHGDSMGNAGVIGPGDAQWMTAGSGIIHQEMPKPGPRGRMGGFQLWANLPASNKMMDPRYRDIKAADVPVVHDGGGAVIRVLCGEAGGVRGPVRDVVIEPEYLDVTLPAGARFTHPTAAGHTVFAYVCEGVVRFGDPRGTRVEHEHLALFEDGDRVVAEAEDAPARFLLVSGRPLREPVAWQGPIVMNTREELRLAFEEYRDGTFIKKGSSLH